MHELVFAKEEEQTARECEKGQEASQTPSFLFSDCIQNVKNNFLNVF